MLRKASTDSFSTKPSRNDRFAQMSRQEQVIEQKKREIQARLQQQQLKEKEKGTSASTTTSTSSSSSSSTSSSSSSSSKVSTHNDSKKPNKTTSSKGASTGSSKSNQIHDNSKGNTQFNNIFTNDGSFLDQFKQLSDPRKNNNEQKPSGNKSRESHSEERSKPSRWSKPTRSSYSSRDPSPVPPANKSKSRFSDPPPEIVTTQSQQTLPATTFPQSYTAPSEPGMYGGAPTGYTAPMLVGPPPPLPTALAMPVPPPQTGTLLAPPPPPPPPTAQTLLPNSMNVPPPPVTAMSLVPPPGALQLQNIPSPAPIRLNEIPDPKPIDLLNIPAPGDDQKTVLVVEEPEFIKTVPPPNKSVPPPGLADVSVPPPLIPPPVMLGAPPPPLVSGAPLPGPPPVLSQPPPMTYPPPPPPPQTNITQAGAATGVVGVGVGVGGGGPPGVDLNAGSASHDAMMSLSRMVAQCGSGIEDIVQQRANAQDPHLWFLFHKQSAAYQQYRQMVERFRAEQHRADYQPEDIYEPDNISPDEDDQQQQQQQPQTQQQQQERAAAQRARRKRKSRWGERVETESNALLLSKVTRNDPGLQHFASEMYGHALSELSDEQWLRAEHQYKAALVSQQLDRKRAQRVRLQRAGRNQYEYDSDEDIDGGTWEHKLRSKEMESTQPWAEQLTRRAEGKHHIGDFLPPDELNKFLERCAAARTGPSVEGAAAGTPGAVTTQPSDYSEHRLRQDNVGFQMLQKLGWREGQGLGSTGTGITEPVNKAAGAAAADHGLGLGIQPPDGVGPVDDEYDAYRKRMMLAYRFRPNPLNNPRRPYY